MSSACGGGGSLPIWLRGRRGIVVLGIGAAALAVGGAAVGWPWLVAAGIAPILLSTVPCLVMCALGLCMMGKGMNSAGSQDAQTDAATVAAAPPLLSDGSEAVPPSQPVRDPESITLS
ncbi:MAG TPA: hypothetical protein VJ770_22520 [Stellaceae bacterium]|nr:hypothetical protein [Stellaceae bacterium]